MKAPEGTIGALNDDGVETTTSDKQQEIEALAWAMREYYAEFPEQRSQIRLHTEAHVEYMEGTYGGLPTSYESMEASHPWFGYYSTIPLMLLDAFDAPKRVPELLRFYKRLQCADGGFCGGKDQIAHVMGSYAAVMTLAALLPYAPDAFDLVDRPAMTQFLRRMRGPDGTFSMHTGGERDVRGVFCATVVVVLLDLDRSLLDGCAEYALACQTYEGGFGGTPYNEAHGGYTYCAVSTLALLGRIRDADVDRLLRWLVERQMAVEGGFQGRCNKLVDACYSFWVGASLAQLPLRTSEDLLNELRELRRRNEDHVTALSRLREKLSSKSCDSKDVARATAKLAYLRRELAHPGGLWFDQQALQEFLLVVAQDGVGGFHDKPGSVRDIYHTCYSFLGLSLAMHDPAAAVASAETDLSTVILGSPANRVRLVHPALGIPLDAVELWLALRSASRSNDTEQTVS